MTTKDQKACSEQSVRMKALWSDPAWRKRWMAKRKASWRNPAVRERRLKILRSAERCDKISASNKGRFSVTGWSKMRCTKRTLRARIAQSKRTIRIFRDPIVRERHRKSVNTRAYKKRQSELSRERWMAGYSFPKSRTSGTRIEQIVAKVLKRMRIKFVAQARIEGTGAVPDFYLPESNRVIECDGTYWHSLAHTKKRDNRHNYEFRKLGLKVSRWSDRFIGNTGRKCEFLLRRLENAS